MPVQGLSGVMRNKATASQNCIYGMTELPLGQYEAGFPAEQSWTAVMITRDAAEKSKIAKILPIFSFGVSDGIGQKGGFRLDF